VPPGSHLDDHHLLPFKLLNMFAPSINIELPWLHRCCRDIPHRKLGRAWQDAWEAFLDATPGASAAQILVELLRLLQIQPFKDFFNNDCFPVPGGGTGIDW
jgi:hypothetical protein